MRRFAGSAGILICVNMTTSEQLWLTIPLVVAAGAAR